MGGPARPTGSVAVPGSVAGLVPAPGSGRPLLTATVAPPVHEREVLTWERFGQATRGLAQQIADDDFRPDLISAIARGGLFAAGALAYALSVKNIHLMNIEFSTGIGERLPLRVMLPPTPELVDLEDARVLVADDVADTGGTLALVHEFCRGKVADVRAAVIYQKPQSLIDCQYVWSHTDRWIDFPWSSQPPVVGPRTGGAAPLVAP